MPFSRDYCPRCGRKYPVPGGMSRCGGPDCIAVHAYDPASNKPFCDQAWPRDRFEERNREQLTCQWCIELLAPGTPCAAASPCTRVKTCVVHADMYLGRHGDDIEK